MNFSIASKWLAITSLLLLPLHNAGAYVILPDFVNYEGGSYKSTDIPLKAVAPLDADEFARRTPRSTAHWTIEKDTLFLTSIMSYRDLPDMDWQEILSKVFPDSKGPIAAAWVSGVIRLESKNLIEWAKWLRSSDKDVYLEIEKGKVIRKLVVDNTDPAGGGARGQVHYRWQLKAAEPVEETGAWTDARDVLALKGRKEVTTRGVFQTHRLFHEPKPGEPYCLHIPGTPCSGSRDILIGPLPDGVDLSDGTPIEISLLCDDRYFVPEIVNIRKLLPGEAIHHPDYRPAGKMTRMPEAPVEKK